MTQFCFWDINAVRARFNELQQRVRDEEANLSAFRRNEAFYLVLSDDEQKEYGCLQVLLTHLTEEQRRRRAIAWNA